MSKATPPTTGITELQPPFGDAFHGADVVNASMNQCANQGPPLSNKKQKLLKAHALAENAHMVRSDLESQAHEKLNNMMLGISIARQDDPGPKFRHGESVCQWWASWMATATAVPASYNKKTRPAWFSGEILGHVGKQSVMYAGFVNPEQHCYHVY